jgi:integrase
MGRNNPTIRMLPTEDGNMARKINRLSAAKISAAKEPGMYADGGGLYLQVGPRTQRGEPGPKSWIFRFKAKGRTRDMGLGPITTVSLAGAREAATECRTMRLRGIDPIEARRAERADAELLAARAMTFDACREAYLQAHEAGWRNEKHRQQWRNTLQTYVTPAFGNAPVHKIDVGLVMKVLEPIWAKKPETASRVRGRIEAILDWARVRGYRTGENPARWRGHLDQLLPARSKVQKVEHHAALHFVYLPDFMAVLHNQPGMAAQALAFTILTAARTGDVIGARWGEINLRERLWTIPGKRMKAGREHRVPLSPFAMAIVEGLLAACVGDQSFVFPSLYENPLSNMAMAAVLRRMERDDLTVHGFRSTFRDWAAERTNFPSEVVEMALAHAVGNKVEAAYRRGDLFEKRRSLMEAWANYCMSTEVGATVVTLKRASV